MEKFCRIQNLHISQTLAGVIINLSVFCRIQNLHISQTSEVNKIIFTGFVEFKIYISLKHEYTAILTHFSFVEFKIYISLKHMNYF